MFECPVCFAPVATVLMDAAALTAEMRLRDKFISRRAPRPLSSAERKDLTDFFHNEKADLLICSNCNLLVRRQCDPAANSYSEERYDPSTVEHLYPDYLQAFQSKETPYRSFLPPCATVVELGSHYGAFLEVAASWGWKAVGVDVGSDSTGFARSRGLDVRFGELADCGFQPSSFDGIFIWNCFDQIENPGPVLRECERILKPGGLLVVRTPNGLFYTLCQSLLRDRTIVPASADFLIEAMAYNNLLGFPYQYGYSRPNLELLIERFGFHAEGMLNAELLTFPLPERPQWVAAQESRIREGVALLERSVLRNQNGELAGPWIELWFRKP